MIHDCEQKENISALRRDVADLSVEISATKDTMARMDKTLALMELRLTTMTDFITQVNIFRPLSNAFCQGILNVVRFCLSASAGTLAGNQRFIAYGEYTRIQITVERRNTDSSIE